MCRECPQPCKNSSQHGRGKGRGRGGRGHHKAKLAAEIHSEPAEVEGEESAFPVGEVGDSSNTVNS